MYAIRSYYVEQTREIVRKFNHIYGETLKEPEAVLSPNPRIKGLDGNEKMSKSLGNAIYLADDEETVTKKVMSAVTDSNKIRNNFVQHTLYEVIRYRTKRKMIINSLFIDFSQHP